MVPDFFHEQYHIYKPHQFEHILHVPSFFVKTCPKIEVMEVDSPLRMILFRDSFPKITVAPAKRMVGRLFYL